jgi:NAD(P)-dependent dehydrogenase (short-subunit alcohol dehydrogenase family)
MAGGGRHAEGKWLQQVNSVSGRLAGKVALITGTGRGQGRVAATMFAAAGARVVGCDIDAESSLATAELVRAQSGQMESLEPVDLTREDDVVRLIEYTESSSGGFDILYNNAASTRQGSIQQMSLEDWRWTLEHDLTLVYTTIKHAVPALERRGGGAIVNVASAAGVNISMPGNARGMLAHCVAKAGVIRMTEVLAVELAPLNIRVNAVSPGVIDTPVIAPLLGAPDSDGRRLFEGLAPLSRIGRPEDIVAAALYLASDEASFITGANLRVDGGSTASGGSGAPSLEAERVIEQTVAAWLAQ